MAGMFFPQAGQICLGHAAILVDGGATDTVGAYSSTVSV
jgi:hypothetical protein